MKAELGKTYTETFTGFTGIAMARSEFLTGCTRVCLQPKVSEDGKLPDSQWFDEPSLIETEEPKVELPKEQQKNPGGPSRYDYPG